MFSKETITEITGVARAFGYEPAALLAVADVESSGIAYALVEGQREPLIRFEGHYFDRRLSGQRRIKARLEGLSNPKPGRIPNPQTQAGRWRLLKRAAAIDAVAAYESTSWGLGQVMGAHWEMLGFSSVDDLVQLARSGAAGQARLMASYIERAGLERALAKRDWRAFARAYNGPAYEKNGYHTKMQAAWRRYNGLLGHDQSSATLRLGSSGIEVEKLQAALNARGDSLVVDGLFGRATRNAVKALQRENGLIVDGVVGPAVRRLLASKGVIEQSPSSLVASLRHLMWRRG